MAAPGSLTGSVPRATDPPRRPAARPAPAAKGDPPAPPTWLDELAPVAGPPWHAMGLRALGDRPLLLADAARAGELAEKRRLWQARPHEVFAAEAATEEAGAEVLALVVGRLHAAGLDAPGVDPAPAHPLARAGLVVQEDLCLLDRRADAWHLVAGSVSFPSHWRLADKLGRPLAALHGPVAHYADELADRVDTVHDRLDPQRPLVRRNWSVHARPDLFAPEAPPPEELAALPVERWWLRSERQVLVALAGSGAVLFTIRTQQAPLAVLGARPDLAASLAAAVQAMSPDLLAYKGLGAARATLVAWLEGVAGAGDGRRTG